MYLYETPLQLDPILGMAEHRDCGALSVFGGTVRDHNEGRRVVRLKYTAFAPLAEKLMREIEQETREKFGAPHCRVIHRLGMLEIGDVAIYCAVRAPHRGEAFAACKYAVDAVKHRVPIWKEEFFEDGTSAFNQGCCIRPDLPQDLAQEHQHDHVHAHGDHHHQHRGHAASDVLDR